jgi:hypothetical protein
MRSGGFMTEIDRANPKNRRVARIHAGRETAIMELQGSRARVNFGTPSSSSKSPTKHPYIVSIDSRTVPWLF